jgi:hypothetical protein
MERAAHPWRWLGIAAALVFGAILTSVWFHWPAARSPQPLQDAAETTTDQAVESDSTPSALVADNPERAKLEELRAMSETFRNTTFLIAIREAGYLCSDLVNVYGGIGDSTTWTAACREMLAYTVSVSQTGTLLVEPTLQYHDSNGPAVQPAPQQR